MILDRHEMASVHNAPRLPEGRVSVLVGRPPGGRGAYAIRCASAGTELGGKCGVGQLVMTGSPGRVMASPGPSRSHARRVGALTVAQDPVSTQLSRHRFAEMSQ